MSIIKRIPKSQVKGDRSFLVLTRKISEEIIVTTPQGERISIMFTGWNGKRARIGVQCPKEFTVNRGELQATIDAEKEQEAMFI